MPEISVIIPNYNHSEYLVQRIESVLNQSFQDFEVILMDDCSTDNSRKILREYSSNEKVSHTIFNEENSGSTFEQWRKGILLAKGRYIWIAESDDWCEPGFLQCLIDGMRTDPKCVISYCQSYCVNDKNEIDWVSTHPFLSDMMDGTSFARKHLLFTNSIFNASMVLWRRDAFPMISPDFKKYKLVGDWIFWMELARHGKVHISGRVLNYFRRHPKNVSGKAFKSGLNFIETLKVINSMFGKNMISPKDYNKALKIQFRNYYPIQKSFDRAIGLQINSLFQNPLTSKSVYYKILLGTAWKHFKN